MSDIRLNPLDIPLTPFEVSLMNPNPSAGRRKDAPVYRVSFEVEQDAWKAFMDARAGNLEILAVMMVLPDIPDEQTVKAKEAALKQLKEGARQKVAELSETPATAPQIAPEVPEQEKPGKTKPAPKPSKGPYGEFWRVATIANLFSHPDLQEWLTRQRAVEGSSDEDVIRATFAVDSRAKVSPDELLARLERDLPSQSMAGLKVTIQRLQAKAAGV